MRSDKKSSQLSIVRLQEFGFVDSQTNICMVLDKGRVSFPVDFCFPDLKEGVAVKEWEYTVDMLQFDRALRLANQLDHR